MLHEQSVCLSHVLGVQRVHAQDLRTRTHMLDALLFGEPLTTRQGKSLSALGDDLDRALHGVVTLLGREVGPSAAYDQAALEWRRILASPHDYQGIAARRAALLFALHTLPAVRDHFAKDEPVLVADLERRVLPAVMPAFLAGMAQRPEGLVVMTSMLCHVWREPMGEDGPVGAHA